MSDLDSLPSEQIPSSKKTKEWRKRHLDWATTKTFTARYGAHRFYRDGKKSMPVYAFNQTSLFLQPLSVISTPKS